VTYFRSLTTVVGENRVVRLTLGRAP